MRPRQLLLDIRPDQEPGLDDFVIGSNDELVARLHSMCEPRAFDQLYLWGPPGSGRSHLLRGAYQQALQYGRPASLIAAPALEDELAAPPGGLVIVDDVDALTEHGQGALFRTFNAARLVGLSLLLSGSEPPARLALREDLRTRIGATLVYQVHALSDAEKASALMRHAETRGMTVDPALVDYLLNHGRRDLPALIKVLDALDLASLEQQRPLTLPLLREILQHSVTP